MSNNAASESSPCPLIGTSSAQFTSLDRGCPKIPGATTVKLIRPAPILQASDLTLPLSVACSIKP